MQETVVQKRYIGTSKPQADAESACGVRAAAALLVHTSPAPRSSRPCYPCQSHHTQQFTPCFMPDQPDRVTDIYTAH